MHRDLQLPGFSFLVKAVNAFMRRSQVVTFRKTLHGSNNTVENEGLSPKNTALKGAGVLHTWVKKINSNTCQTPTFIQDFVVILGVFALLQTRLHLFLISVHLKNEKIEVMRVCFFQGQKQQQNWVLGPGVLAPYEFWILFFFSSHGLTECSSVSSAMIKRFTSAIYEMRIIKVGTSSCQEQ